MMEQWNNGILGLFVFHLVEKYYDSWDEQAMDRKNINRGFKKLRVWQDAVSLYVLSCKIFTNFPFELKKVASNSIDAAHSISRNISEGYCRRSLKEYLNHLNIALGSCGEFHSCYNSCKQAEQITAGDYELLDHLHYKVENALLKLIESLQKKQADKKWEDSFHSK
jgi:four helix bundle protein